MERLHRISGVGLHFVRGEKREQPCEIGAQLVHIRNGENHPCQRYDEDDVGMFQQMGAFQEFAVDVFFQCQKHEEDQSPQHKVPACTVPQSGKRPDCQHVPHGFPLAHTAAAQREIDIVLEPASQRDVPSSPELAGGAGHIREVEVLGKLEAQHFSHANCHHGIAGEVEVDLKAIGKRSQPRIRGGDTIIPDNGQIIPQTAHGVRQQRLGTQSEHKGFHALLQQTDIDPTFFQLRLNFTVHADRTGDQLREHAEVHAQIQNTPCGTRLSGVNIDQVGRDLKGEEADAKRHHKRYLGNCRMKNREQGIQVADQEVGVFEYHQQSKVVNQSCDQIVLGRLRVSGMCSADHAGKPVVDQQGQQQQQGIPAAANGVKDKAADHQCDISVFLRCGIICQQENRQKLKQKCNCAENHR